MSRYDYHDHDDGDRRGRYRKRRRHNRHHKRDGCGFSGVIHRVLAKSRELTGLGHGMTIALYVLGFIFAPLLTGLIFVAMWYWTTYPDNARRNAEHLSRKARETAQRMRGDPFTGTRGPRPVTEPDIEEFDAVEDVVESAPRREPPPRNPRTNGEPSNARELRDRFERLDRRARAIEEFVASEEYRLQREFDKMDGDDPRSSKS